MKALIIFCDGDHVLSFLLKKGFQHCLVCIEQNGLWIQIDYVAGVPDIRYLSESDFDLASFYRDQGMTVIETVQKDKSVTFPFVLRNCVGMAKQILCINNFALSPYGLYKRMR